MGNTAITIAAVGVDTGGGVDELVKASAGDATAGYLDAKVDGTTITVSANTLSTIDGGIDHDALLNTHNLTTDIDHNTILNNHNLTTDIDHDQLTNYVALEHYPAIDEDDMVSDSDTSVPTQQSVKAYVDAAALGQVEVFNTGGTWTCPTGVNYIMVSVFGGGGGGGGGRLNSPHNSGTGGGGGAAVLSHILTVTPASTYTVTVGAGGAGGAVGVGTGNGSPGGAGGSSSMVGDDFTITANGGGGGQGGQNPDQNVVGAGGVGTIEQVAITSVADQLTQTAGNSLSPVAYAPFSMPGGDGANNTFDSSRDGGPGGGSFFGQGGSGGDWSTSANPTAGTGVGGGGGGGRGGSDGAAGAPGLVVIWYSEDGTPS
jgi:hypothetical protein